MLPYLATDSDVTDIYLCDFHLNQSPTPAVPHRDTGGSTLQVTGWDPCTAVAGTSSLDTGRYRSTVEIREQEFQNTTAMPQVRT